MDSLRISDASLAARVVAVRCAVATPGRARHGSSARRRQSEATVAEQRLLELLFADETLRRGVLPILKLKTMKIFLRRHISSLA